MLQLCQFVAVNVSAGRVNNQVDPGQLELGAGIQRLSSWNARVSGSLIYCGRTSCYSVSKRGLVLVVKVPVTCEPQVMPALNSMTQFCMDLCEPTQTIFMTFE